MEPRPLSAPPHSAAVEQQSARHESLRHGSRDREPRFSRAGLERPAAAGAALAVVALAAPDAARADKISHPTAIFDGLDKITGRIISFEVAINETVQFGALQITPRVCYSRPLTEAPQTDAFAQVDEIDEQKKLKRIFSGWMFADSPGLHGIEHPIFDIWLTGCKGGTVVIHDAPTAEASAPNPTKRPDRRRRRCDRDPEQPAAQAPKKKKPKPQPAVVAAPDAVTVAPIDPPANPSQGNSGRGGRWP